MTARIHTLPRREDDSTEGLLPYEPNRIPLDALIMAALGENADDPSLAPSYLRRLAEDLNGLAARAFELARRSDPRANEAHLIASALKRHAVRCYAVSELHERVSRGLDSNEDEVQS